MRGLRALRELGVTAMVIATIGAIAGPTRAASPDELRALDGTPGALGVVVPCHDVTLSPEFAGKIAAINVGVGDRVRQGQLLFSLDDAELRQRLEIARAALRSAQAEVVRAQAAFEVAETVRLRRERAPDVFSEEDREKAAGESKMAAADLESSKARVAQSTTELEAYETDLRRAHVRAPFDGAVATRYLDAGSNVTSATPVIRVVADHCVILRFAIPPDSLAAFKPGSASQVRFAGNNSPMRARVRSVAPQVDPAVDLVLVEAEFEEAASSALPRPGTICRVVSSR
jgi:membrane fusion protein (multidrug efflux system)